MVLPEVGDVLHDLKLVSLRGELHPLDGGGNVVAFGNHSVVCDPTTVSLEVAKVMNVAPVHGDVFFLKDEATDCELFGSRKRILQPDAPRGFKEEDCRWVGFVGNGQGLRHHDRRKLARWHPPRTATTISTPRLNGYLSIDGLLHCRCRARTSW